MSVSKFSPAGCCATFTAINAKNAVLFFQQAKVVLKDTLQKTAFFTVRFFMQASHYLSRTAVLMKDAFAAGFKTVRTYTADHPKEVKIAAVALGVGIALSTLVSHLCHEAPPIQNTYSQIQ